MISCCGSCKECFCVRWMGALGSAVVFVAWRTYRLVRDLFRLIGHLLCCCRFKSTLPLLYTAARDPNSSLIHLQTHFWRLSLQERTQLARGEDLAKFEFYITERRAQIIEFYDDL